MKSWQNNRKKNKSNKNVMKKNKKKKMVLTSGSRRGHLWICRGS
jgi:hypothetical protein